MKSLILLLFLFTGITTTVISQEPFCEPNTITTNPDYPGNQGLFDWRLTPLNYGMLIPVLLEAINEQQALILDLQVKVSKLED
jgi:hypothetical protein